MSVIKVSNLTFSYGGVGENVFENVSFQIGSDWKLGFTGRNGRGKTTFLNLLLGKYEYTGNISSSTLFEYFPYPVSDIDKNTLEIAREIAPGIEEWQILREFARLYISPDVLQRPFSTMSGGERTKVLLAVLFLKGNNFLLIDEPTDHLDMRGREAVGEYLSGKSGFILVSHDRVFLDNCIDHILSINKTNIEIQKGNFSTWWENKRRQDEFELAESEQLKKDIHRLSAAARRSSEWSDEVERSKIGACDKGFVGHKAAKMMKRSKALEARQLAAADEKTKLLRNIENAEGLKLFQDKYHSNTLISLKDISISYGERLVCEGIDFTVERGDRVALTGRNGCGKSSVLKLICGERIKYEGEFRRGSGVEISYAAQDTSSLIGTLSDYCVNGGVDESLFKALLRKLDFSRSQFELDMRDFSAGQKKKVLIARSLCKRAHLLVWDEPLNFIDVISRIQIEELILEFSPTILFVEHDRAFCGKIATKEVKI